jgi:energy-coupling factor transport system substrate-specific component
MVDFEKPQDPHRVRNNIFIIAGTVIVIATYLYLIIVQPAAFDPSAGAGQGLSGGTPAIITLAGYVIGALLIAAGAINRLPTTTVVLVPIAIAINIAIGQFSSVLGLPVYLDSIGTILVGVVAGPAAGAVTGGLSNVIWGLTIAPLALPFAIVAIIIGALAGWAARIGVFRTYWAPLIAGLVTGIIAALASSPISAFIFGGATGGGTGALVAAFQGLGATLLGATTLQGFISDPLDKIITFTVVMLILLALPTRIKQRFPFVREYNVLPGMKKKQKQETPAA